MQEELKKREAMKTAPYVRDGVKENWFLESIEFENFSSLKSVQKSANYKRII